MDSHGGPAWLEVSTRRLVFCSLPLCLVVLSLPLSLVSLSAEGCQGAPMAKVAAVWWAVSRVEAAPRDLDLICP